MIAYVYDGSRKNLILKDIYSISSDVSLAKSSKDGIASQVTLLANKIGSVDELNNYDIIKIEHISYTLWGFITDIELDSHNVNVATCSVLFDTDGMIGEDVFENGTQQQFGILISSHHSILFADMAPHFFVPEDAVEDMTGYFTAPDGTLDFAQAMRQLFRQGIKFQRFITPDNRIEYFPHRVNKENQIMFHVNFDGVLDSKIEYTKDNITMVRCWQKVNDRYYHITVAYLHEDGTITYGNPTVSGIVKPFVSRTMIFERNEGETADQFYARINDEARNELANQSYNNSIEFVVDLDNYIYRDIFFPKKDDLFYRIGDAGNITLRNGNVMRTIISEISIVDNVATIRFGLGSTRLMEVLRRRGS